MLFDLRGRRRRAVQVTYVMLALLMGGGLVLFGIGGDVSGGLFDAFGGRDGGGTDANSQIQQRIERQEKRLQSSPQNEAVLAELVRLNYQAAASEIESGTSKVPESGQDDLRKAAAYWDRYVAATDNDPDPELARTALVVFDQTGLDKPDKAKEAVRILAADANDTQTYLLLVQYAAAAGDMRTADLAGQKAVDLAPKKLRKDVEKQVEQIVVDLSKATFIDSTTLGVLVGGVKRLRPAGGSLALVCTDDNITKIFEITGLDRVFPIHSSRDEALAAVSAAD